MVLLANTAHCVEKFGGYPIAANNQVVDGIIPECKIQLPPDPKKESQEKTERLLKFFRSPEQQFMPLGFYGMVNDMTNTEVLINLRKHGMNLVHKYGSMQPANIALRYLQAAKKAGIGVLQNLPTAYLKTADPDFWPNHISALADNKQILIWDLPEELPQEDLKYLEPIAENIREKDPYHRPIITYVQNYETNH